MTPKKGPIRFSSSLHYIITNQVHCFLAAENKTVPLKEKLAKSLTHIKDMLVVIEAKIERERQLLSQISDNLNNKIGSEVARTNHEEPTDIWWQSTSPVTPAAS